MPEKLIDEKKGEVAYVTLNRPECKNAVDHDAHLLLCEAWKAQARHPAPARPTGAEMSSGSE